MVHVPRKISVALISAAAVLALIAPELAQSGALAHTSTTKTNYNLNAVGSDTIFCVDQAIDAAYNTYEAGVHGAGNTVYNTPPVLNEGLGCETTPATFSVPSDSVHPAISYTASGSACAAPLSGVAQPWLPPNGSSSGITCESDDAGSSPSAGSIAFTRSSRGRKSSDPANLDFWAFALDAVSWNHFTSNTAAPASLTTAQIQGIYNCTYTNWSQVGGTSAPIKLYYPQVGSGTGAFFAQVFLNNVYPTSTASCPITFVEENDAALVAAADQPHSIEPYSLGDYTAQTNGTETNLAAGTVLGKVNGTPPIPTTVSEAAAFTNVSSDACTAPVAGEFCASRYVYHTVWASGGPLPSAYRDADIALVGVPSTGVAGSQSICHGKYNKIITTYGFKPLKTATTAQATTSDPVPGTSKCRQF